ncbi:hypothetical protein B0H13DRAFT_1962165 [Mycena leptocephala]|nr:hypothetical protein B0H13DRAFT_1962165 [Mycena leptocephala]
MTTMVPLHSLPPTPVSEWTKNENDVLGVHATRLTLHLHAHPGPTVPGTFPAWAFISRIRSSPARIAHACNRQGIPPAYLCGSILSSCLRFVRRHSRPRHSRCIPSTSRIRSGGDSYGQCRPNAAVVHAHAYHRPNLPQTLAAYLLASIVKLSSTSASESSLPTTNSPHIPPPSRLLCSPSSSFCCTPRSPAPAQSYR